MIIQEQVILNGKEYTHTYSDEYRLVQVETGVVYDDAYDIIPMSYTYIESEEKLPQQEYNER